MKRYSIEQLIAIARERGVDVTVKELPPGNLSYRFLVNVIVDFWPGHDGIEYNTSVHDFRASVGPGGWPHVDHWAIDGRKVVTYGPLMLPSLLKSFDMHSSVARPKVA